MGRFRIHCKIHDSQQRVVEVGIGDKRFSKDQIWNWIDSKEHTFYTTERGYDAEVRAQNRNGSRYLTTAPDGISDNNLDELQRCQ